MHGARVVQPYNCHFSVTTLLTNMTIIQQTLSWEAKQARLKAQHLSPCSQVAAAAAAVVPPLQLAMMNGAVNAQEALSV